MLLAATDASSDFAFDAVKDNTGMVVVAVIVIVSWLAFRRMVELSERGGKKKDEPPKEP